MDDTCYIDNASRTSSGKKALLFDDEQYKLTDCLARRIVFKPLAAGLERQPFRIACLNLTREHFKPGATKFRDLTPEAFNMLAIWMNSLAFACDKKKRISTTPQEKKKAVNRAQQRRAAGDAQNQPVVDHDGVMNNGGGGAANMGSAEIQQEKEGNFINGASHLTVYVETLLETDPSAFRVGGFRLWVMDTSNDKSGLDMLTKGVKETLLESANIQRDVQFRLGQIAAKQQQSVGAAKRAVQKTFELHNRYRYTDIQTDALLINAVDKYFAMDGLLVQNNNDTGDMDVEQQQQQQHTDTDGDEMVADEGGEGSAANEALATGPHRFIDRRAFLTHNREGAASVNHGNDIDDGTPGRPRDYVPVIHDRTNTMHIWFGKEQAMVYHVEKDGIQLKQRTMGAYFGETSDDVLDALESRRLDAKNPERLEEMRADEIPDAGFRQFPYPSITYQVDQDYLSFDVFADLPLPHHLGTYLYNTINLEVACTRINRGPIASRRGTSEKSGDSDIDTDNNDAAKRTPKSVSKKKRKENLFGNKGASRKGGNDDENDQSALGSNAPVVEEREDIKPLGIYDVEYEITSSTMHIYDHYLTDSMRQALVRQGGNNAVSRHVRDNFIALITSDIRKGLMAICNQVDKVKPYIAEASHNRDRDKLADLPYLEVGTRDGTVPPFRATTPAYQLHNRDKRHLIDRKVYSVIGADDDTVSREKHKNLSTGNEAYFRSIIAQRRPVDATVENAMACMGATTYDRLFLERDIYLVLDVLNRYGYAQIDKEFFDPRTNRVRKGQTQRYVAARRAFMEAIIVEFYGEFFTNSKVSMANIGIRNDLIGIHHGVKDVNQKRIGMRMPLGKFNMQVRPFHAYKLWVYSYFAEHDAVNNNYKTSDILFHARYHHCRSYPPNSKDPKMNVILSGQGMAGKSHKLGATKDACPSGVAEGITHMTNQAMNVDQNMNDMLIINEEMSNKLISPAGSKNGAGTSESANDDARNNFKERATAGVTVTLAFYNDEETGDRRARISKCQCQNVILGATNNDLSDSDPNVMSRFLVISVPRAKNDHIGNRAQDKNRLEMAKDETKYSYLQEQVREVHRIYYMVECMIKSGILANTAFGVAIDGAQIYMTRILDMLQAKYGIATNDIRKRKHVIEMARCMCISFACWYGLTSPLTRHLQYDVYTGEFIGFNPRVLLDGIMPYLVVTKDQVINAISCLSCLWGHEYMDQILKNISTSMCELHRLRESDFVRRPRCELEGPGSSTMATSALTTRVDPNAKKGKKRGGFGGGGGGGGGIGMDDADDELVIDYNYISVTSKTHNDIHNLLSNSLGELAVAPNDIGKVLRDLGRTYIQTPGYEMGVNEDGDPKLVKSRNPAHCIPRKIVAYGGSAVNGLPTIAISVAFLKQKLPHLLPDSMIEDLVQYTSFGGVQQSDEERAEEDQQQLEEDMDNGEKRRGTKRTRGQALLHDIDEVGGDLLRLQEQDQDGDDEQETIRSKAMMHRMLDAISLRPGSVGESSVIKAIRDVLQNDVLEFNPDESEAQRKADEEGYADLFTGQVPWLTYATSEHPQPLLIGGLFPDLRDQYNRVHGHNKEITLADKIAVLPLVRKKGGEPLVYYNYNTISETAKSSLSSLFATDPVQYPSLKEGETDPHAILEVQELEAIRKENARFEQVHKQRFRAFAEHVVVRIDRDLDLSSCANHLLDIGYPVKYVDIQGRRVRRLCNYPPHTYMDLVDFRDKLTNAAPVVPIFADVQERIAKTRQIIEAQCGHIPEDAPVFHSLMYANYDIDDLRDLPYPCSAATKGLDEGEQEELELVQHRRREFRSLERSVSRTYGRALSAWQDTISLGDIANASQNMMVAGTSSKRSKNKKAKGGDDSGRPAKKARLDV